MIINTRPEELGQKTNLLLEKYECNFVHLPLTQILKKEPSSQALKYLKNLSNYDAVIFTSQSAVWHGAKFFQEKYLNYKVIPIISIGLATQDSLLKLNISSTIPPTYDSSGLATVIKEKAYKKCLVFCGQKNPRILHMTNADIDTFPCYVSHDETKVDFRKIKDFKKLIILIYTQQSLEVLTREFKADKIQEIILIAASERIQQSSKDYGFTRCIVAESPHDTEMVQAALGEY